MSWHETEKKLDAALCNFCNDASDPFEPVSEWNESVQQHLADLSVAYNEWYKWMKATKGELPNETE